MTVCVFCLGQISLAEDIQVIVATPTDERLAIRIDTQKTVGFLKQLITEVIHIPIQDQRLQFEERVLSDNKSLSHYNIHNEDMINLFYLKMRARPEN